MNYFLITVAIIAINLLFPSGWLNAPYLVASFVFLRLAFARAAWFIFLLLALSDLLNLRYMGFSFLVVVLCGGALKYVYGRFLPHRRWIMLSISLVVYMVSVQLGLFLGDYLL